MKTETQNHATLNSIFASGNYFGLLKAAPTLTTYSEVNTTDHGSYARVAVGTKMGSPSGSGIANDEAITFPEGTAGSGVSAYFLGVFDAASAGNLLAAYPIVGANTPKPVVSITRASTTASVVCTGHGFANGDTVWIHGTTLDAYNIVATISNVSTDGFDYTVSGSPATPAVADVGGMRVVKITPRSVGNSITPTVAVGTLTAYER